ncbi:MAG: short-chain fatty acid transporter [Synergistaceae bacterium]|jgi:short-chain fatty acids transporter|nr:short-chain fatty acid transporter [Synergistaceae bacterium]
MKALTRFFVVILQKYLPDAFLFAVVLTFIAFGAALLVTGKSVIEVLNAWGDGLWGLLGFAMQMILIVVTGHTMAISKPMKKLLALIASAAKTPAGAGMICSFVAGICCWINWGFGLIVAALLARELARRVKGLDYGYVVAAGYAGFVVWHGGLSGSIPLAVATKGHLVEKLTGLIPTTETIFSTPSLIISALMIISLPIVFKLMCPEGKDVMTVDPALLVDPEDPKEPTQKTLAEKMEYSRLITLALGLMGVVYLVRYFYINGAMNLSLNIVIFVFMWLGIILHGTPIAYIRAVNEAIKGAGGIAVQFPLYGGIQGILIQTGLAGIIANWFITISNQFTFPLFTYLAGGIINFFVPSGGGQWVVQGPINIPAGIELGVSHAKVAMSIAYGDQWTNMIQPFWALPLLGIAKLGARDIMGYCVMVLIVTGVIMGAGLLMPW